MRQREEMSWALVARNLAAHGLAFMPLCLPPGQHVVPFNVHPSNCDLPHWTAANQPER